jgi:hypothetical protein
MVASYLYNDNGMTVYSDTPIGDDTDSINRFTGTVGKLAGVELCRNSRYAVDVVFATMFEPEDVIQVVLAAFKDYFGLPAVGAMDYTQILARRSRIMQDLIPEPFEAFFGGDDTEEPEDDGRFPPLSDEMS